MRKTIRVDEDAYKLLVSLKQGNLDSFTKVILRNIHHPLNTAGELLDWHESQPPPNINLDILKRVMKERGPRSGGRK